MNTAAPSAQRHLNPSRKMHHGLLALGCALVVLLLGSSYWQGSASLGALSDLRKLGERVGHLDNMLIQLLDAENAVRGYLLSGNRGHLEPYENSLATTSETLDEIHQDLGSSADNDEALKDLHNLVTIKLRSLDEAVERGIAGEEARIQSKRYTDRIRERLQGLRANIATEGDISFERSTNHVKRTSWVVTSLALGALVLMAILYFVLEQQFKLREQLASMLQTENERLDLLVRERTAELNDLASYLTNTREAEKAWLARELHDELGSLLTAAKLEANRIASQLEKATPGAGTDHLTRMDELLDRVIALKRQIIDGLRPPLLEELGLVITLRTLGEEFAKDGEERLNLHLPDQDVNLAPAPALALYRIAQEALTNIRKHAHAKLVTLALRVTERQLELEIADDGVGFRTGTTRLRHHGLMGMKHRVQMCTGNFSLTSHPGRGTRILVSIPLMPVLADQDGIVCRT